MHKIKNWRLLSKCSIIIILCLMCMPTTAKADMVTFNLDNVYVNVDSASQKMTGTFEWTYDPTKDFKDGSGVFTDLYIPVHGTEIINLNITIETDQIEFSLDGNHHDRDVGIMLDLIGEFSPSQSAAIDISTSKFNVQKSGRDHPGTFLSGGIVPVAVPEPTLGILLGISLTGLIGVGVVRKIRQKKVANT